MEGLRGQGARRRWHAKADGHGGVFDPLRHPSPSLLDSTNPHPAPSGRIAVLGTRPPPFLAALPASLLPAACRRGDRSLKATGATWIVCSPPGPSEIRAPFPGKPARGQPRTPPPDSWGTILPPRSSSVTLGRNFFWD